MITEFLAIKIKIFFIFFSMLKRIIFCILYFYFYGVSSGREGWTVEYGEGELGGGEGVVGAARGSVDPREGEGRAVDGDAVGEDADLVVASVQWDVVDQEVVAVLGHGGHRPLGRGEALDEDQRREGRQLVRREGVDRTPVVARVDELHRHQRRRRRGHAAADARTVGIAVGRRHRVLHRACVVSPQW